MPVKKSIELDRSGMVTNRFLQAIDLITADRSKGKITLQKLGNELGISSSNINRLRRDIAHKVTLEACCRLCDLYHVSPYWLIQGKGAMLEAPEIRANGIALKNQIADLKKTITSVERSLRK